jgi:YD repeat-containing protein
LQTAQDFSFNCLVLFIDKGINPLAAFIRKSILFEYKRKFEDAPLGCAAEAQLKAETRFGEYCTAIEYLHDELEIKYHTRAGHFTLYYYDLAGNLSKTVLPAGIRPCTNPAAWAGHIMVTKYRHNTLGQVGSVAAYPRCRRKPVSVRRGRQAALFAKHTAGRRE